MFGMRVTALMFVRNGEQYLERSLRQFAGQGIDAAVIDHGSADGTAEILRRLRGAPVREVMNVPYEGYMDIEHLLILQREQMRRLGSDWYVRVDADEILQSDRPGETLAAGLARVAADGSDVVNFNEFAFVYESDERSYAGTDYVETMRSYYHFAPQPLRLMRAFRAGLPVDNVSSAGHTLPLDRLQLYPGTFVLRHYIALSRAQAEAKFVGRSYPARNLARGWHHNRVNLRPEQFAAPPADKLCRLAHASDALDASRPMKTHFWQWERSG